MAIKQMMPAILSYAETAAKVAPGFEICVVTRPGVDLGIDKKKNVRHIKAREGEDIALKTKEQLKQLKSDVQFEDMSIVTDEANAEYVVAHMGAERGKSASFVVAGKAMFTPDEFGDRVNRLLPSMAMINLMKRSAGDKPNVILLECSQNVEEELKATGVSYLLEKISKLDIGAKITEFMESLAAVAVSV